MSKEQDILRTNIKLYNEDYFINWLIKFQESHKIETDPSYYEGLDITDEDKENVKLIGYFIGTILEYGKNNNATKSEAGAGFYYNIGYNNVTVQVGAFGEDVSSFFASVLYINPEYLDAIKYEDIKEEIIGERLKRIEKSMKNFDYLFQEWIKSGESIELLKEKLDEMLFMYQNDGKVLKKTL